MTPTQPTTLNIAVDGSALGNPGPAGWAWYIDEDNWAAGGWAEATNNQGELQAVIEALKATSNTSANLHILADSQYVINSITKWMPGWKKKGWKKSDGKPVQNKDFMITLDQLMSQAESAGRKISFEWVKGHADHELNEAADARAHAAATSFKNQTNTPAGPGLTTAATAASTTVEDSEQPDAQVSLTTVHTQIPTADAQLIVEQARAKNSTPHAELARIINLGLAKAYGGQP